MLSLNLPAFDAKLPQGTEKNVIFDVIRRRYVAWPLKNAAALRPLSSCSQGVSAGAYGKWGAGTAERYKETLWYSALSTRPYRPDDCEYKAPEIEITQKVFDQITRYNMVLKVDYLIVSNGLGIIVAA